MSNKLREERVVRRVTQLILGIKSGVCQTRISYIENNLVEATAGEKCRLAETLGVSVDRLFPEPLEEKPRQGKMKAPEGQPEQVG